MLHHIIGFAVPLMALGFAVALAGLSLVASFRNEPVHGSVQVSDGGARGRSYDALIRRGL
ncbi:hypothetical protein [Mesorhizobium mediterraneum]|uniref:hypothetical protein n=1 Tax=Mesorhizobium mediterraneum TaxID=43617 RepID=UPI00177D303D|nr:hypothetical protein [Mesorhizobium mediterraneum]